MKKRDKIIWFTLVAITLILYVSVALTYSKKKADGDLPKVPKMVEKFRIEYGVNEIQIFFKGDRLYGIIGDFPHFLELVEIDHRNGEIIKRIQMERMSFNEIWGATSDGENFWLSDRGSANRLFKVSEEGDILEIIETPFKHKSPTWISCCLWLYSEEKIYKFDVDEKKVLDEIDFPEKIFSMDSLGDDLIISTYDRETSVYKLFFLDTSSKKIYDEFYLNIFPLQDFAVKDGIVFTVDHKKFYKFDLTKISLINQIRILVKFSFSENFILLFYGFTFGWIFSFSLTLIGKIDGIIKSTAWSKKRTQNLIEREKKDRIFSKLLKDFENVGNLRDEIQDHLNREIPDMTKVSVEELKEFWERVKNR
ncbi:MAG: hypothetical protein ACE5K0_04380 [Candidatus Methanofastidiosia archaeon]